jgi:archaetidylinositol phosphate synthase
MASRAQKIEVAFSDMGGAALEQLTRSERQKLEFRNARRVQHTIVTAAEKRILRWLAERMPAWINSDHLTALGFAAQLMVGVSYVMSRYDPRWLLAGCGFLALNWYGDSLDGTLARFRDQQRPRYGFYVDHIIDSFGAVFLCGGLAVSGYMTPLVAMALLACFLLLSIETYLATYCLGEFYLSHFLLGPTEIRLVLGVGNVALLYKAHVHFLNSVYLLFDIGGVVACIGMTVMLVISAIRHATVLYQEERLP